MDVSLDAIVLDVISLLPGILKPQIREIFIITFPHIQNTRRETNMNNHEYKLDTIPIHTDVYGGLFVFCYCFCFFPPENNNKNRFGVSLPAEVLLPVELGSSINIPGG